VCREDLGYALKKTNSRSGTESFKRNFATEKEGGGESSSGASQGLVESWGRLWWGSSVWV